MFPPQPRPGETLHPLYRMLIEDVANSLSRHATFAVTAPHSSFDVADTGDRERLAALRSGYLVTGFLVPGSQKMALRLTRNPGDEIIWAAQVQAIFYNTMRLARPAQRATLPAAVFQAEWADLERQLDVLLAEC